MCTNFSIAGNSTVRGVPWSGAVMDGITGIDNPGDEPVWRIVPGGEVDYQYVTGSIGGRWNCSDAGSEVARTELVAEWMPLNMSSG